MRKAIELITTSLNLLDELVQRERDLVDKIELQRIDALLTRARSLLIEEDRKEGRG